MATPSTTRTPTRPRRLRRLIGGRPEPHDRAAPEPAPVAWSTLDLLVMAAWLGVVGGLLEVAVHLGHVAALTEAILGIRRVNRHFLWMTPASCVLILVSLALALALARRLRPAWVDRVAVFVLAGVGIASLLLSLRKLYEFACVVLACGLGSCVSRVVRAHPRGFRRLSRWSLPSMALGVAAVAAVQLGWVDLRARADAPATGAATAAPNVLLIVMDTVRADATSLEGYDRDTTPNLDRLAGRGVRFRKARATAPWTLPSHASMFTGRWTHELSAQQDTPLDGTYPTLAEFLNDRGYATAGFAANTYFCNLWYGLDRGFERFEGYTVSLSETLRSSGLGREMIKGAGTLRNGRSDALYARKDADAINADFLGWLDGRRPAARPFFAFLNYYDAHAPYLVPDRDRAPFGLVPEGADDVDLLYAWEGIWKERPVTDRELRLARDAYDDCLAYLDDRLGRLLDQLRRRGVLDETLVIVTSDHGEAFGEDGFFTHGVTVTRPVVHVPLVIVPPRGIAAPKGASVAVPVSLRELPATVVGMLGLGRESPFPGRSLARFWGPGPDAGPTLDEPIRSETKGREGLGDWGSVRSIIADGRVYIVDENGTERFFDYEADPGETRDLAAEPSEQEALRRFRLALERLP